jgi:hypothetical protein
MEMACDFLRFNLDFHTPIQLILYLYNQPIDNTGTH